ncbi:beta-glucan synthesis-associated [Agrocybe pediades]|nr:beta-glucan synthesis-associated [Agrocybe pediades]
MSRNSRRQSNQHPFPQYASVPHTPSRANSANSYSSYAAYQPQQQQYQQPVVYAPQIGGPRPIRSSSASSRPRRSSSSRRSQQQQQQGRHDMAMGVATGNIGAGYGPYSYHQEPAREAGGYSHSRYTNSPSETSLDTAPQNHGPSHAPPPPPIMVAPTTTTVPQHMWNKEPDFDDALHYPDPRGESGFTLFSWRGWVNMGAIFLIIAGLIFLFAGFPVLYHFQHLPQPFIGFNVGGINASGQIPELPNVRGMIDPDTPKSAWFRTGDDGLPYELTFSDEFNTDGRTFYPGDDPYWEAEDQYYWTTNDKEYYDPAAVTTANGKLVITMSEQQTHNLNFQSGMITSWNKLCFTTGYVEVSVSLPGVQGAPVPGLWPAAWTLGNLGRAGYGASTQGMWPYSYDSCDVGTFPAQIGKDGQPAAAATGGKGGVPLSSQPGQKLSACTCPGSDHPGPSVNVGRGVPEIDIIEAQVNNAKRQGDVSQSFQVAPYDMGFKASQAPGALTIYNTTQTIVNTYTGGPFQQALSAVSLIDNQFYGGSDDAFTTYAFEYWSDPEHRDDGYITWYYNNQRTWKATAALVGPNSESQISQRLISEEPMYIIMNLAMSFDFQPPDFKNLKFPAQMLVDYVRIYQRKGIKNGMTCNPPNRPTTDYIQKHIAAYTNANFTVWSNASFTFPRNSLYDGC